MISRENKQLINVSTCSPDYNEHIQSSISFSTNVEFFKDLYQVIISSILRDRYNDTRNFIANSTSVKSDYKVLGWYYLDFVRTVGRSSYTVMTRGRLDI